MPIADCSIDFVNCRIIHPPESRTYTVTELYDYIADVMNDVDFEINSNGPGKPGAKPRKIVQVKKDRIEWVVGGFR